LAVAAAAEEEEELPIPAMTIFKHDWTAYGSSWQITTTLSSYIEQNDSGHVRFCAVAMSRSLDTLASVLFHVQLKYYWLCCSGCLLRLPA
jgi:hypothetical protein